jgi:hypothetical protein
VCPAPAVSVAEGLIKVMVAGAKQTRRSYWLDDVTLALVRQQQRARAEWGEWLAGFRWSLYCVLTFAYRPSPEGAERAVQRWLVLLQQSYPRLNAYVSYDLGKATSRPNVHVLLGGLFASRRDVPKGHQRTLALERAITLAKRKWTRGRVRKIEPYDARRGAGNYLAQYCSDTDLVGDIFGRLIRKKKQRRRRQRPPPRAPTNYKEGAL